MEGEYKKQVSFSPSPLLPLPLSLFFLLPAFFPPFLSLFSSCYFFTGWSLGGALGLAKIHRCLSSAKFDKALDAQSSSYIPFMPRPFPRSSKWLYSRIVFQGCGQNKREAVGVGLVLQNKRNLCWETRMWEYAKEDVGDMRSKRAKRAPILRRTLQTHDLSLSDRGWLISSYICSSQTLIIFRDQPPL